MRHKITRDFAMNIFSTANLPITLVVALIIWAWFSLFSALVSSLF